jgi:hypothetical protein
MSAKGSAMSMSCSIRMSVSVRGRSRSSLQQLRPVAGRQARRRLVQHQHARIAGQRHADLELAALPVATGSPPRSSSRPEAHALGQLARLGQRGSPRAGRRKEKRFGRTPRTATNRFSSTVSPLNSSDVW